MDSGHPPTPGKSAGRPACTTLADLAVAVFGYAAPTTASEAVSHSAGGKVLAQLLVGALAYIALAGVVQFGFRTAAARTVRRGPSVRDLRRCPDVPELTLPHLGLIGRVRPAAH